MIHFYLSFGILRAKKSKEDLRKESKMSAINKLLEKIELINDEIKKNLDDESGNLKVRLKNIRDSQEEITEIISGARNLPYQETEEVLDNIIRKLSQWGRVTIDSIGELNELDKKELLDLFD
ncbi:MAG: hypothetical protein ABIA11_02330 [Patescibacteria group bacterium]